MPQEKASLGILQCAIATVSGLYAHVPETVPMVPTHQGLKDQLDKEIGSPARQYQRTQTFRLADLKSVQCSRTPTSTQSG